MQGILIRQGHRLLQIGVALLLFTSFQGFLIPHVAVPRLGRSVHTLSALVAVLFLALGLVWPRLRLGGSSAWLAFGCLVYSGLAIIAAFLLGSLWGAGATVMPLAAGNARGSALEETVIMIVSYSSAPTGILAFALILWGLRSGDSRDEAQG